MTKAKPKKPAAIPVITVSPEMKRLYAALSKTIASTSKAEATDFDARWEAAAAIVEHEPPLYVVGGFKNASEFFRGVMREEPRVAQRCIRVAKYASPAEEAEYGMYKLEAAIGLIEAKLGRPLAHPPLPVSFAKLRVPVGKSRKTLTQATVAEVRAATSAISTRGTKRPKSKAHAAIEAALKKVTSLTEVGVHERDGLVSFQRVPVSALQHFVAALTHAAARME